MNRELEPADLLPAIQSVAGALVTSAVIAEAARLAAERELVELRRELAELREWMTMPAPAPAGGEGHAEPAYVPGAGRPANPGPPDWRNGHEPATDAGEAL